jgi:hypothetical protein
LFSDLFGSTTCIGQNEIPSLMDIWCAVSLVYLDTTDIQQDCCVLAWY